MFFQPLVHLGLPQWMVSASRPLLRGNDKNILNLLTAEIMGTHTRSSSGAFPSSQQCFLEKQKCWVRVRASKIYIPISVAVTGTSLKNATAYDSNSPTPSHQHVLWWHWALLTLDMWIKQLYGLAWGLVVLSGTWCWQLDSDVVLSFQRVNVKLLHTEESSWTPSEMGKQ